MKKFSLNINGRNYDIEVDDAFGAFLERRIEKDFNFSGNNDHKAILQAFIRSNHELFEMHNAIEAMAKQIKSLSEEMDNKIK